ncbi:MAG: glutathione S-transferase family protein [Lysobacterales bacterium]|nr:MAG: glutathione S-transferase family protein [Xanthomonadales bacterium]
MPIRVVGGYLSPYVRKVLACLEYKGLAYEIDPIVAFYGDERFGSLSPLRRVPVLVDDRVTLADSTVICEYLEDRYPTPALHPEDVVDRARARWLEEYADSRMGDVFVWGLFDAIACFLRNAAFARYKVDPLRWPRTATFVDRVLALDCLARLQPYEAPMLRTPIPAQREALVAAGAPVSADTLAGAMPRRGVPRGG